MLEGKCFIKKTDKIRISIRIESARVRGSN